MSINIVLDDLALFHISRTNRSVYFVGSLSNEAWWPLIQCQIETMRSCRKIFDFDVIMQLIWVNCGVFQTLPREMETHFVLYHYWPSLRCCCIYKGLLGLCNEACDFPSRVFIARWNWVTPSTCVSMSNRYIFILE